MQMRTVKPAKFVKMCVCGDNEIALFLKFFVVQIMVYGLNLSHSR